MKLATKICPTEHNKRIKDCADTQPIIKGVMRKYSSFIYNHQMEKVHLSEFN